LKDVPITQPVEEYPQGHERPGMANALTIERSGSCHLRIGDAVEAFGFHRERIVARIAVGMPITGHPPQSGRIEARTGLRMMPLAYRNDFMRLSIRPALVHEAEMAESRGRASGCVARPARDCRAGIARLSL
jgi:hypothetical protein